jgi:MinD superfamily P-loop ATPase
MTINIAIASGKGGTGKTTVSVNLARMAGRGVCLFDCDVEEPNCHIFLQPEIQVSEPVYVPVPEVDHQKCDYCGECSALCQFSGIVTLKESVLTFPELCHGCGGCMLICPQKAIHEVGREMGVREMGTSGKIEFHQGRLRVSEAMSPPLIRAVKQRMRKDTLNIIDAPPGTSCPVIEAIKGMDYVVLVTEPTPFGLHDLTLAVEMVRTVGLPFGVLVNRANDKFSGVVDYCKRGKVEILMEIPDDRRVAEAYSRGEMIVDALPEYKKYFVDLLEKIYCRIPS